jgi:hypothetical protein
MDGSRSIINTFQEGNPRIPKFGPGPRGNLPYFFISNPPRSERGIRHCKQYRDGFLDYTIRGTKTYETLTAWALDCGSVVNNVRYGFESDNKNFPSISLEDLLHQIYPTYFDPPKLSEFEILEKNLSKMNLGFSSVYVATDSSIIRASEFNAKMETE